MAEHLTLLHCGNIGMLRIDGWVWKKELDAPELHTAAELTTKQRMVVSTLRPGGPKPSALSTTCTLGNLRMRDPSWIMFDRNW